MRLILLLFSLVAASCMAADDISRIVKLPPGFHIEVAVDDVPDARSMALDDDGTLFIATRRIGRLYAVEPEEDGGFGTARVIAEGLSMPNGIAFQGGDLYLAENHRIVRYPDVNPQLHTLPPGEQIASLPSERHHGWRYLAFGPDGRLYVSIGAPCNICNEAGFASIIRMDPDGGGRETFAEGWLDGDGGVHGRPVDLLVMPDGSLLLSDDHAGVIYRIYYRS